MTQFRKFLFDTAFTPSGDVIDATPPAPSFSEAELERARESALMEGKAEGRKEAAQFAARLHTEAITKSGAAVQALCDELDAHYAAVRADAARLAFEIAKAIAGEAMARFGAENARALIDAALEDLRQTSAARVRLAPAAVEALGGVIEERARLEGLDAQISLVADPAIAPGDARLEFAGAAYARTAADIAAQIESLIHQYDFAEARPS